VKASIHVFRRHSAVIFYSIIRKEVFLPSHKVTHFILYLRTKLCGQKEKVPYFGRSVMSLWVLSQKNGTLCAVTS
jgi:hypothetical protein